MMGEIIESGCSDTYIAVVVMAIERSIMPIIVLFTSAISAITAWK